MLFCAIHPQNQFYHKKITMEQIIEATRRQRTVFGTNHRVSFNPLPQARHRVVGNRTYDPQAAHRLVLRFLVLRYLFNKYGVMEDMLPLSTSYVSVEMTFFIKRPNSHFINGNRTNDVRASYQNTMPTTSGDIDNYVKFFLDAIDGIFYQNDREVVSIKAMKIYSNGSHGRIIYKIRPFIMNTVTIDAEDESSDHNNNINVI